MTHHLPPHPGRQYSMTWPVTPSDHFRRVHKVTSESCAHVWPDELTFDALCTNGCGVEYGQWSA